MALDPSVVAAKWRQNLTSAIPAIKASIQQMTVNPMQRAAAAGAAYIAGVQDAYNSGKWQAGLQRITLEEWKTRTADMGTARIASGAQQAMPRMMAFLGQLLPYTAAVSAQIKAMPNATVEDRRERMLMNFEKMRQFRFRGQS